MAVQVLYYSSRTLYTRTIYYILFHLYGFERLIHTQLWLVIARFVCVCVCVCAWKEWVITLKLASHYMVIQAKYFLHKAWVYYFCNHPVAYNACLPRHTSAARPEGKGQHPFLCRGGRRAPGSYCCHATLFFS